MTQRTTSDAQVASTGAFLPDSWSCWEGSVILNTGKETFEVLGLPGAKLSARMPGAPDQHRMPTFHDLYYFSTLTHHRPVINVSLNTQGANTNVRGHDFILDSFTQWDRSRERSGQGQWDFAFHVSHPGALIYESRAFLWDSFVFVKDLYSFRRQSDGSAFALACPASSSQARRPEPPKCLHPDLCSAPASESTRNLCRAQGTP